MAADQLATRLLALNLERVFELGRARLRGAAADIEQLLLANREARLRLLAEAEGSGVTVPGLGVLQRFGLSIFELDVLHLAVGIQVEPRLADLVRSATPDSGGLTVGIALRLLASSIQVRLELAGLLGSQSRLVRAGLLRSPIHAGLDGELVATRRIVAALCGRSPRDQLPPWATCRARLATTVAPEVQPTRAAAAIGGAAGGFALVTGGTGTGKTTFARLVVDVLAPEHLAINVAAARRGVGVDGLSGELAELIEDSVVLGLPVVLDDADLAVAPGPTATAIADAIEGTGAAAVVVGGDTEIDPHLADRAHLRIALHGVRGEAAIALWQARAGSPPAGLSSVDELLLTPRRVMRACDLMARLQATPSAAIAALGGDSSNLLQPTRAQMSLADIVLSDDIRAELLEVISAIRSRRAVLEDWGMARRLSRGRGLSVLFDGEPGTGKTMAAEVIAHEVDLPLQRVNASALVDKYIGETEKNLTRVFAQARDGNHIVLFDEADALFGNRTDVKGANDRYANLEVNVLLQLMEEHSGIVLLTTNLKRNIDQAFMRRIANKVEFPLPDPDLRIRLWGSLLPPEARDEALDLPSLARVFPLSGGDIKSICLRAAYRAAAEARKISMADLVECAQLECQAMGRVVTWHSALPVTASTL